MFLDIILQKILDFVITSSTKANAKGTFVKWSNENSTHGARFSKPDVAQEVSCHNL